MSPQINTLTYTDPLTNSTGSSLLLLLLHLFVFFSLFEVFLFLFIYSLYSHTIQQSIFSVYVFVKVM